MNITSVEEAKALDDINGARDGQGAWNATVPELFQAAVKRGEGVVTDGGGLAVVTAPHTGRSPSDKFIVRDETTEDQVWWDGSKGISREQFGLLKKDFLERAAASDLFVQELHAGADPDHRLNVRVLCEYAWHALFIRHLMIRPGHRELRGFKPHLTIIDLPNFKAEPRRHGVRSPAVIACDLTRGLVLIGGTSYAGEMKKSVFTVLNYLLPERGVMPMHCSANVGAQGDTALFFGLSGTGKTTLSADPQRVLIGDDEHGWSRNGIFNFEGGCYAKAIHLSQAHEPEIFAASRRFATVLENVVVNPETRAVDFDDGSLTENTRAAYPLDYIPNASASGTAGHPRNIIMLTADAFGVMPPIARLTPAQAMYHFLSGYTAKVAGTEKGVSEPEATFSTCFGQPFMPRHPAVYGNLLRKFIAKHNAVCWMVNTGWTGGPYGTGKRMPIKVTRALLAQALDGKLAHAAMRVEPWFGFEVPLAAEAVERQILNPRDTWGDASAYDAQARKLCGLFSKNFASFEAHVDKDVIAAGPRG